MTLRALPWPLPSFDVIRRDFGYERGPDEATARWLAPRLSRAAEVLAEAETQVQGEIVYVVGAADSARLDVERAPRRARLWTADGATTAALEAGRRPDAIVTDLDGNLDDEVAAAREGALVFVHAHGDNGTILRKELARFPPERLAGTCQVEPPPPLVNPGGFTDGDRAVCLALALGAREVRLLGFDFAAGPGRYSGRYDPKTKPRKLAWAQRILEGLRVAGAPVVWASSAPPVRPSAGTRAP